MSCSANRHQLKEEYQEIGAVGEREREGEGGEKVTKMYQLLTKNVNIMYYICVLKNFKFIIVKRKIKEKHHRKIQSLAPSIMANRKPDEKHCEKA